MTAPLQSDEDRLEAAASWCVRLADGPLAPGEQEAFTTWLAIDPRHGDAFDEVALGWRIFEAEKSSGEMLALRAASLDTAREAGRTRRVPGPVSRRDGLVLAASLAAVALGTGLWLAGRPALYETGLGERRVVVLADGSRISLDASTRVAVRLTQDLRSVQLHGGRAKFDVAKDVARPFTVDAGGQRVLAVGTAFSVESLTDEVRVILYEGRISVAKSGSRPSLARAEVRPNEELVVAAAGSRWEVRPAEARSLSWEAGLLTLENEPLGVAVERFNRYSPTQLSVTPPAAALPVSGVFRSTDSEAFIEGVAAIHPLTVRRVGPDRVVLDLRQGFATTK